MFFLPIKRGVGDSVVVLAFRGLEEARVDVSHCDQQKGGEKSRIIRGIHLWYIKMYYQCPESVCGYLSI